MDYLVCVIAHGNIYSQLSSTHLKRAFSSWTPLFSRSSLHLIHLLHSRFFCSTFFHRQFHPPAFPSLPFASTYTQHNGYSPSTWFRFPSCSLQQGHHRIDPSRRHRSRSHPCKAPDRHARIQHNGEQGELTRICYEPVCCIRLPAKSSSPCPNQMPAHNSSLFIWMQDLSTSKSTASLFQTRLLPVSVASVRVLSLALSGKISNNGE